MKNLFRNAALLGASLVALNAAAEGAASQGPVLSFGGSITAGAVGVNQRVREQGNSPAVTFISKGNLVMNVGGTSHNGMGYGAVGVLLFDRAKTLQDRIDEAYIYLNHDCIGNLKIGDTEGVTSTMMYTGDDVLGGLGGTSGDLDKFINMTRGVAFRPTISSPTNTKATKIVWVSPELAGFQIGIDFTPSTKLYGRQNRGAYLSSGGTALANDNATPYSYNLLAGGLSYNKAFTNFNVGLYLVGQTGKSKNDNVNTPTATPGASNQHYKDTNGYQIGALFDYQNWQLAASYWDNKKSLMRSNLAAISGSTNTQGVNAAVGYDFARNANVAVGYTHASRKVEGGKAKADVAMITMDYVVAPGWVAFAELDHFRLRAPNAAITSANILQTGADLYGSVPTANKGNHGTVFVLGTKLRF
jgi:hypothetical protein